MRLVHIKGIEIIDDGTVPEGEIWFMCPMQDGGKVRYMFNLIDHRMTQPGADKSFFLNMEEWLTQLRNDLISDSPITKDRLDLILAAMADFKAGKDPRTLAE